MYDYRNDFKDIINSIGSTDIELNRGLQEIHRTLKYLSMLAHAESQVNNNSTDPDDEKLTSNQKKSSGQETTVAKHDKPVVFNRKLSGAEVNGFYLQESELRKQGIADLPDQSLVYFRNGTIEPTGNVAGPSRIRVLKQVIVEEDEELHSKYLAKFYDGTHIKLEDDVPTKIPLSLQDAESVNAGDIVDFAWYDKAGSPDRVDNGKIQWRYPIEKVDNQPSISQKILNKRQNEATDKETTTETEAAYDPHFAFELPDSLHNILIISGYNNADSTLTAVVTAHGGAATLVQPDKTTSTSSNTAITNAINNADAIIICTDFMRHRYYGLVKDLCNSADKPYAVANMSSQIHVERGLYRIVKHLSPVDSNDIEYPA